MGMVGLTIFTTLKPCFPEDLEESVHTIVTQTNALQSWRDLGEDIEIIVVGFDDGADELAYACDALHIKLPERGNLGKPLVSHLFERAWERAAHDTLAYVNADIILPATFRDAVAAAAAHGGDKWLMVGQRWDVDIEPGMYLDEIRRAALDHGKPHARTGMDYFAHPRGLWQEIPDFEIGHFCWDSWLLHAAQHDYGAVTIDASAAVTAVHQNHGGALTWQSPETARNKALFGGRFTSLDETTHVMTKDFEVVPR